MSAANRVLGDALAAVDAGRVAGADGVLHRGRGLFTDREWSVVLAAVMRLERAAVCEPRERRELLAEARGVIAGLMVHMLAPVQRRAFAEAAEPSPERTTHGNLVPWSTLRSRIALRARGLP